MSTKTGYTQVMRSMASPAEVKVPNSYCRPVHLWTVVRHGTRYPSKQAIKLMNEDLGQMKVKILEAVKEGSSFLCEEDVEELKNWKTDVTEEQAKMLHPEGEMEMVLLGERWLNRLGELLTSYEEDMFRLRSTNTQRSQQSGHSFTTGLWTRLVGRKVKWEQPELPHDSIIRFYKLCNKWKREVKKNPDSMIERRLFEESQMMKDLRLNMTSILGLSPTSPLTMSDLDMMYVMCNFDLAWQPSKHSIWCYMFPTLGLQLMEYREDLEYYWVDGPGYPVTGQQACVLAKDMMDTFRNISLGQAATKGSFYFTHSGTILKLLTFLKIGQDNSTLKSDNVLEMHDRKWRTSFIGPFGANIAFVLQRCEEEEGPVWRVGLWVNEVLTMIPGCEEMWCEIGDFEEAFPEIDNCDFDTICRNNDSEEQIDLPDDKY